MPLQFASDQDAKDAITGAAIVSQKYPEVDQAATIAKYKEMLKLVDVSETVTRIPLKSRPNRDSNTGPNEFKANSQIDISVFDNAGMMGVQPTLTGSP